MSEGQSAYLDWAEKYRPVSLNDIVGNDAAVKALRQWAQTYGSGKRAVILYGSPGIGKTSAALALAHDLDWDYIEMNASDQRTKDAINRVAGSASHMGTFEGTVGRRLLILDEADNLHGNADRGGESAIINVIKSSNQPIILIANDFYALSKPLRDVAEPIQFRSILSTSIVKALKKICSLEEIKCEPEALMKIAERTNDLRSAVNDLQAAAIGGTIVTLGDVTTGEKDVAESIFKVMGMIFRGNEPQKAMQAARDLDESPEDLIAWVDENIGREYHDDDLERGYDALAKADIFLGRVRRRQDYSMWRYASFMMINGVNRARHSRYGGYAKYSAPTYWQKLGRAKARRNTRDAVAAKIGAYCHCSKAEARSTYIPMMMAMFEDHDYAVGLSARLKLEENEIAFLMVSEKASKKVEKVYEASRDLIEKEVDEEIDAFAHFHAPERTTSKETEKIAEAKPKRKRRKVERDGGEEPAIDRAIGPEEVLVIKPEEVLVIKPEEVLVIKPEEVLVIKPEEVLVIKPEEVLVIKPEEALVVTSKEVDLPSKPDEVPTGASEKTKAAEPDKKQRTLFEF